MVEGNQLELFTHLWAHVFQFVVHVDAEEGWCVSQCSLTSFRRVSFESNPLHLKVMSLTVRFTLYVRGWTPSIVWILATKGLLSFIQLTWDTCLPSFPPLSVHPLMLLMLSNTVSVTTYKLSNLQCLDHIGDKGLIVMLKWWRPWSGPNHISQMEGLPIRVVWRCLQQSCWVDVVIARLTINGSGVVVQLRYVSFTICGTWR